MTDREVIYEIKEGIAFITLNRPEKLNAINPEMRQMLWDAFQDVKDNPVVRCAIVTGSGRAFSTGHDLVAMANARANEGPSTGDLYVVQSNIWKPIIAAINGVCLAQGCGIALGSDIRIASVRGSVRLAASQTRHLVGQRPSPPLPGGPKKRGLRVPVHWRFRRRPQGAGTDAGKLRGGPRGSDAPG